MDFGDWFWLVLFGVGLVFEIVVAIFRTKWTLSAHFWKWFAIGKNWKEDYAGLRWFILLGLVVSVGLHFLLQVSWVPIVVFALASVWSVWYHYAHEAAKEDALARYTQYSLKKGLSKSAQSVLEAIGGLLLAAAVVALTSGVDFLFTKVDELSELIGLGIPAALAGGCLFVVKLAYNWWKVTRGKLLQGR